MTATGRVLSLHRWPVKSMGGESVEALRIDERGAAGDRTHAIFDVFKGAPRRLTAREAPRLLAWSARYAEADPTPDAPPLPILTAPDGAEFGWDDPDLPAALAADLGREVTLHRDEQGQQDLGRTLLVTTRATHEQLEAELGRPLDLRRWRTNAHVELDAPAREEDAWEGRSLRLGDAGFQLLHPCERCAIPTRDPDDQTKDAEILRHLFRLHEGIFGMNARPLGPATVRVGDPVDLA